MTTYRVGQRVRIEWPNGSAVEGAVSADYDDTLVVGPSAGGGNFPALYDLTLTKGRTVTVLSDPRPDEPTGLGAVVEADCTSQVYPNQRRTWVRAGAMLNAVVTQYVWYSPGMDARKWDDLIDPVVLHEGWTP